MLEMDEWCLRFLLSLPPHLLDELVALLVVEDVGEALEDGGGGGAPEGGQQRRVRRRGLRHGAQHPHGREGVRRQPPRVPATMDSR